MMCVAGAPLDLTLKRRMDDEFVACSMATASPSVRRALPACARAGLSGTKPWSRSSRASYSAGLLTSCKRPSQILFLDALPAASTGKILKHKLREIANESRIGPATAAG